MTDMVKGFGCHQAYESLSCRNPRAPHAGLWGKGILGDLGQAGHSGAGAVRRPDPSPSLVDRPMRSARFVGSDAEYRGFGCPRHALPCGPLHGDCGPVAIQAMPGHGAFFRIGAAVVGGARGWHQRANVSMMVMWPPQQGHDGRVSAASSGSAALAANAASRSHVARLSCDIVRKDFAKSTMKSPSAPEESAWARRRTCFKISSAIARSLRKS